MLMLYEWSFVINFVQSRTLYRDLYMLSSITSLRSEKAACDLATTSMLIPIFFTTLFC